MTKIDNFLRPDPKTDNFKTDNFKTDNFMWPAGISGGRPESLLGNLEKQFPGPFLFVFLISSRSSTLIF